MTLSTCTRYLTSLSRSHAKELSQLPKRKQVFAFGAGIYGELGNGEYTPSSIPVAIDKRFFTKTSDEDIDIVDVGCGWANSHAITRDGRVYIWGWPHDHRTSMSCALMYKRTPKLLRWLQRQNYLGALAFRSGITKPELIPELEEVVQFSSGAGWSAAVTKQGHLYTFGDGFYGQLCQGPKKTYVDLPTRVVSDTRGKFEFGNTEIVQASCGFVHTLILDKSGQVFSAGRLDCYAVGIGHVDDHFDENILALCTTPQSLWKWHSKLDRIGEEPMGPVIKISTGRNISAFLTQDGCLWTCGKNGGGALGIKSFQSKPIPTKIDPGTFDGERITDVACGFYHMVALTESGRVFTWGIANHGQTGRSPQSGVLNMEAKANTLGDHRYALYNHEPGQILEGIQANSISAGGYYTAVLTSDGLCIVMGGDPTDFNAYIPKLPFSNNPVHKISFGLSHGIALCYEEHQPNDRFRSDTEAITEEIERKLFGQRSIPGPFDHFAKQ